MQSNILEYLEESVKKNPDKIVFRDDKKEISFLELSEKAKKIGTFLANKISANSPVIVLAEKDVRTVTMYLGVLYAGCYYVPVGTDLPELRIKTIIDTIEAPIILTCPGSEECVSMFAKNEKVKLYDDCIASETDELLLEKRRQSVVDTDPAYVIFTSGSTGVPKGVVESHRALIDYIDVFAETFDITGEDIFGNQAPLDYIAAIRDIYIPLKTGGAAVIISKTLFSQPANLFDLLNKEKVTVLCWVVSAFCLCSDFRVFDDAKLDTVKKVFFTGSVMPMRQLRDWQEHLPKALFVNHYGPTEITASCTYHIVDHPVEKDEVLPIGISFKNTGIILLKENGLAAEQGEQGEICVRGTCLASGYYKNPEKTREVFVNNPLNDIFEETIYKTGDIGSFNENSLLMFHGRKDSQIKHMGHRIELGEIEIAAKTLDSISECCCLYDHEKLQLWLFYSGQNVENTAVVEHLKKRIPGFMVPRKLKRLETLPKQFNGKINMQELKQMMKSRRNK